MFCFGNQSPRSTKTFNRDVEEQRQEEFKYASTLSWSSHYSVFVVRLAIMVMLAILIALLTLLTWHFTRAYTKRSLSTLAFGLRHELLQRPILRMWSILNSTVEIATAQVKMSEFVIKRYSGAVTQAEQVELYDAMKEVTWALFASRKALSSLTINYRNGFVQAFHRDHRSNNTFYIYSDLSNYSISGSYMDVPAASMAASSSRQGWDDRSIRSNTSAVWYRDPLDPVTGARIGKQGEIPPDELINIAGISQVPDGAATWHVAVSKYSDSPLLSAALPVWDPANESIVAVVGVTTALYSVGQLMREIVEFHSGHIYLTSQEGWLIATSTNTPLWVNSTKRPKLIMAVDSEDPVIQAGALCLQRQYGNNIPPGEEVHIENAKLGNQLYYIDSFFLNLKRLPMVGVIIIPRKYIMGKIDERAFKTLVVLISASVCTLITGCVCIFILTNGVSKEMKLRAELICHLDARRKAEASSNYKSQFLANMSHELRTPMAAVIGLLDILICDDSLTNEQSGTVTQIRKCSTALLRLLNNILDLSKVESGKLVLEETEFDLSRELEGLLDMFSVQCFNHNVETVLDLSDDMPKLVKGDSGRVVQIFANLLSNSLKFTTCGHIILRGWCENSNSNTLTSSRKGPMESWPSPKVRFKDQEGGHCGKPFKKDNDKTVLWFEVDDTGCGIDPSKWESVFESFEQADPSTTRLHGGTGLGLCIVRTLVNKMGGEIKVMKKNGEGTLMKLCLPLGTPMNDIGQFCHLNMREQTMTVLLALHGRMGRVIMSQWLEKNGVHTREASDWNELTQMLQGLLTHTSLFAIVIDIGLLDLSTAIWKKQLAFLDKWSGRAKFAWILYHDTSNSIKSELRRRGHPLMVNRPLYKGKMIQILEAIINANKLEPKSCLDSPDESENSEYGKGKLVTETNSEENTTSSSEDYPRQAGKGTVELSNVGSRKETNQQNLLAGLRILLAEDTPVLQRVATIMLEKMGAKVVVVGDGQQAVDAIKSKDCRDDKGSFPPAFDLILMDCQMPKMDGYEATKAIRRSEVGSGSSSHIPIVAVTAHAMSSDEAKCLEVGMDAYLTKPIDRDLMLSTILSLTNKTLLPPLSS
ncbi:unnamed protein product [Cuscuta campestris]|uniref:histidine kinase n=1 Tax=Cuscuta campestris TaxID=132261 RepID=A0A484NJ30_9ASTE|nr:unnamed protein product [Cuscuta campestris]